MLSITHNGQFIKNIQFKITKFRYLFVLSSCCALTKTLCSEYWSIFHSFIISIYILFYCFLVIFLLKVVHFVLYDYEIKDSLLCFNIDFCRNVCTNCFYVPTLWPLKVNTLQITVLIFRQIQSPNLLITFSQSVGKFSIRFWRKGEGWLRYIHTQQLDYMVIVKTWASFRVKYFLGGCSWWFLFHPAFE